VTMLYCTSYSRAPHCTQDFRSVGVDRLYSEIKLLADSPALWRHQPANAQLLVHLKNLRLAEVLLLRLQGRCGFYLLGVIVERHQTYYSGCPETLDPLSCSMLVYLGRWLCLSRYYKQPLSIMSVSNLSLVGLTCHV